MKKYLLAAAILGVVIVLNACHKNNASPVSNGGTVYLDLPDTTTNYYPGFAPVFNKQATLGRVLFYDRHLSLNNAISCGTCHRQEAAFADNLALSRGFENRLTGRNTLPIQNMVENRAFSEDPLKNSKDVPMFWDGREASLIGLVSKPISNHIEMGIADLNTLSAKLAALPYYKDLFTQAYGTAEITAERIAKSLSYFVASIKADNTRFDAYDAGTGNFSALELQGRSLFEVKYKCATCHNIDPGGYKTDGFIDIGLELPYKDLGLGAVVTGAKNNGRFRVPNIRNIALTAPYMHDGRFKTLSEVIDHYSKGIQQTPNLEENLRDKAGNAIKMNISEQEKAALIAFLNTLTDTKMVTDAKFADPFKVK